MTTCTQARRAYQRARDAPLETSHGVVIALFDAALGALEGARPVVAHAPMDADDLDALNAMNARADRDAIERGRLLQRAQLAIWGIAQAMSPDSSAGRDVTRLCAYMLGRLASPRAAEIDEAHRLLSTLREGFAGVDYSLTST